MAQTEEQATTAFQAIGQNRQLIRGHRADHRALTRSNAYAAPNQQPTTSEAKVFEPKPSLTKQLMGASSTQAVVILLAAANSKDPRDKKELNNIKDGTLNLDGAQVAGLNMTGFPFHKVNSMSNANMAGVTLSPNAKLNGVQFVGTDLKGVTMPTKLEGANFQRADLQDAKLSGVSAGAARFDEANLTRADAKNSGFERASFNGAKAPDAKIGGNLNGASMNAVQGRKADIAGEPASISGAQLQKARVSGMQNTDASGADLAEAKLGKGFDNAVMQGTNLQGTGAGRARLKLEGQDDVAIRPEPSMGTARRLKPLVHAL